MKVTIDRELLEHMRNFTVMHDSGVAGVLRGRIDAILANPTQQGEAVEVVAWVTPEKDRVITALTVAAAREDGGAMLSSVRPYSVPCMTVAQHQRIVAALSTQQSAHHPDDVAVERFAAAMKAKLARCREKGRHGWQTASAAHLSSLLYHHMYKADPLDVANLAMMLHQNGQAIELPHEARKPVAQQSAHVSVPTLADVDRYRIELLPEHDAGYLAKAYVEESEPVAEASGFTAVEAVRAVIAFLNGGEA